MTRRAEALRLVFFCGIVLLGAVLLVRPFTAKTERFDASTLKRIQARQPDFVFIGDSLLGYSIEPAVLEQAIGGRKIELLWHGGAASAAWYLYLKNFVVGAGVHPRRLFIFIHDTALTDPRFRTTGKYAQELQRLCRSDEPLFRELTKPTRQQLWWFPRLVATLFPADSNRAHYQEKADRLFRRLVARNRNAARELETRANQTFDVANVRADEPVVTAEGEKPFENIVGTSFLPPILALARDSNLPITFVRPKKRPGADAEFDAKPVVRAYYSALRQYLSPTGCDLVDLTNDQAITADMFADSVHIAAPARGRYTKHFAEILTDHFR
jgi:hypothetical protein